MSELYARLERDPSKPLAAPLRLDFHVLYVGLRGAGDIIVDFEPTPIGKKWVAFVARGRVHQFTMRTRRADAWMLLFTPEFLSLGASDPLPVPSLVARPSFPLAAEITTLTELLASEYARPDDELQRPLIGALLRGVLLHVEREARATTATVTPQLARFFRALERDVLATRSAEHYARAAGLTKRRLGELLQERIGRSTKQVIDERVVLESKRLLVHTELSVKELAARVGFSEPTNFVKFFRLHAGETPQAFRARFHHPSA